MSGILDPRILPFRSSAYQSHYFIIPLHCTQSTQALYLNNNNLLSTKVSTRTKTHEHNYLTKMTISYTGDVANASTFGCFNKILFRWKGSVYKLVYKVQLHISQIIISNHIT